MSQHNAAITWKRNGADFGNEYDRSHEWAFDGGVTVPASSAKRSTASSPSLSREWRW